MKRPAAEYLLGHRSHDTRNLAHRWKAVSRKAGLLCREMLKTPGGPVLLVRSKKLKPKPLYISTGVHGDEPAPPQALIDWAEDNISYLRSANILLLPMFNPTGLALNTRADENGRDLNRLFHDASLPHIAVWQEAVRGHQFSLGLCLHEDYDAVGLYAYELNSHFQFHYADYFMQVAEQFIPRDSRQKIEGRAARHGIIRKKTVPTGLPGMPEAIALFPHAAPVTVTFETPSEYSLFDRVRAHRAVIEAAVKIAGHPK